MDTNTLKAKLHDAAGRVSYYNAAEGDCWYKEADARALAKREFAEICEDCRHAGIDVSAELAMKKGGYLL